MVTMVAVRQESYFDGLRGEWLYGCRSDVGRQRRCPCRSDGLDDYHPGLAVGADTYLPSLLLAHFFVGFLPALLWDGRSSKLLLYLAELVAA